MSPTTSDGSALRLLWALAVLSALLLGALGSGARPATAQEAGELLLPDLKTRRPDDVSVERKSEENGGHKLLRFSNEIVNQGEGPLEIAAGDECPGQDPEAFRLANQNVFEDTNASEVFDRGTDEIATSEVVGCTRFHPQHNHWHLEDFAQYDLHAVNKDGSVGAVVATSDKVGFCLVDTVRRKAHLPSSPEERYYGGNCNDEDSITGISIGWSDVYGSSLPHQWIYIEGIRSGTYCLRSTADPEDQLEESNDSNNKRGLKIRLDRRTVDFRPRQPCIKPSKKSS